jgi:hypothetical protein
MAMPRAQATNRPSVLILHKTPQNRIILDALCQGFSSKKNGQSTSDWLAGALTWRILARYCARITYD